MCKEDNKDVQVLPSIWMDKKDEYNKVIFNNVQEKLHIGEILSYKNICELLDQDRYGGNQKKAQLKEFLRYFDFEYDKDTKKYLIKEIYDEPLPPSLKLPANSIYSKHIKIILLSYLLRHANNTDGAVYISSQKLYQALGLVNQRYIDMYGKEQRHVLKNELRAKCNFSEKVDDRSLNFYISNFYERCRSKFSSIINSTLDSLERQNYITHSKAYHLYKRILDINNEVIEVYYGGCSTDSETADLLEVEREVMDEFGYKTDKDIWFGGKTNEYYARVTELAQELYPEIHSLYRCHKIICTKANILKALNREQETNEMKQLNDKILNFIDNQAVSNYEKTLEEDDYTKRYTQKYLDAQYYLSDKLIKIKDYEDNEEKK